MVTRGGILALLSLLAVGVFGIGMFSRFQRKVVFPGPQGVTMPLLHRFAAETHARELELPTVDGETLYGWHRPADGPGARRAVLYFHGNASSVLGQLDLQARLNREGWDFVEIHYRGYPGSTGVPSEAGVYRDADAAWRFVVEDLGIPAKRVAIHGRSLGGGVAAELASRVEPGALILESTFTSVVDLARAQFGWLPIGSLLEYRFGTADLADEVACPVFVAHGGADSLIDVSHGRTLAETFDAKQYLEAPGIDHNDVLFDGAYVDRYIAFLEASVPKSEPTR